MTFARGSAGWSKEDALGHNMHELLRTVSPIPREEIDQLLHSEGSWRGNLKQRRRDIQEIVVARRKAFDSSTNTVLEINRDITGQLRAEDALRQTEKLAAMGRMAGIIAHEINNPLEAVTNIFYILRTHPSLNKEGQHFAALAEQELQRAAHITRQTLSFYRESNQPIAVSLIEVIDNVLELHHRAMQTGGTVLEKRYLYDGVVYAFPGELRQVFLNLISNAIQAMPSGGTLRIRISRVSTGASRRGLSVSIIDTGTGVSEVDARKLFQPFFSTKSTKGTGLGLWISRGIVQKYEGSITFRTFRAALGMSLAFASFCQPKWHVTLRLRTLKTRGSTWQNSREIFLARDKRLRLEVNTSFLRWVGTITLQQECTWRCKPCIVADSVIGLVT